MAKTVIGRLYGFWFIGQCVPVPLAQLTEFFIHQRRQQGFVDVRLIEHRVCILRGQYGRHKEERHNPGLGDSTFTDLHVFSVTGTIVPVI